MFYKIVEDNIITMLGFPKIPLGGIEISEDEYNTILSIIQNKPDDTETTIYKLNAETLEYEPYDRPEEPIVEETDPEIESIIEEVANSGYN